MRLVARSGERFEDSGRRPPEAKRRIRRVIHAPLAIAGLLESRNRIVPVSPGCMASDSWTPEIGSRLCLSHRPGPHLKPIRHRSVLSRETAAPSGRQGWALCWSSVS
jgi:hypothetical protein